MTDRSEDCGNVAGIEARTEEGTWPSTISRRQLLLRGGSAAVPAILTLHSGAALAQSSNLMGTVQSADAALDGSNNMQCLGYESAVGGTPAQLDLGNDPSLHVQYVPKRQYYLPNAAGSSGDWSKPVSMEYVCQKGGTFWWRKDGTSGTPYKLTSSPGGVQQVNYGFMVSATALASFTADIDKKTIFL
jgi:hypothetical protein